MRGGIQSLPPPAAPVLLRLLALAGASLSLAGCRGMGPATVARDRFDYVAALSVTVPAR